MPRRGVTRAATLARAHGMFNMAGGLWPLIHMRSFEAVLGPKTDRWLVRTVAGLLVANGLAQFTAEPTPMALRQARTIGVGTAVTLAAIDLRYAPPGRISRVYLLDAAAELAWIVLWCTGKRRGRRRVTHE
jgi:hypothetical protein